MPKRQQKCDLTLYCNAGHCDRMMLAISNIDRHDLGRTTLRCPNCGRTCSLKIHPRVDVQIRQYEDEIEVEL
jgi:transcription elongation factor Elf1